ncbi:MAG: response regulator [bacterium]|nr:response regulator [bacterium]
MEEAFVVVGILFICVIIYCIYKIYKCSLLEKENKNLLSNVKILHDRNIEMVKEYEREKWNFLIHERTLKENNEVIYTPDHKIRVLIADYIEESAVITNRVLTSMGLETDVVPSGEDALHITEQKDYDLIITNNVFKGKISGPELLANLKSRKDFNTPVIILTVSDNEREYFVDMCGFDEYIVKTLDIEKAKKAFKKVLPNLTFKKVKKQ